MKKMKQLFAVLLSVVMLLVAAPTAFAAVSDTGFSDVSTDAWYADAVAYVRNNGLMSGTGPATFGPDETMTHAMLPTVLYRAAGTGNWQEGQRFSSNASEASVRDWVAGLNLNTEPPA